MTITSFLEEAAQRLSSAGLPDAYREAEFVVAALLKTTRSRLLLDRGTVLTPAQTAKLRLGLAKRARRWPLAYITRDQPFRDLVLHVTPAVLISRPETEELVEKVGERIAQEKRLMKVADIGTGSGCIAVSLARLKFVSQVFAVDRSAAALKVAQKNARAHPCEATCRWFLGDLAQPLINMKVRVDILVANLPYVTTQDLKTLEPEVHREPMRALDGGRDGLDLVRRLILQAPKVLNSKGWIFLEIGKGQDQAVERFLRKRPVFWEDIQVHKDLSGVPRFVEARAR